MTGLSDRMSRIQTDISGLVSSYDSFDWAQQERWRQEKESRDSQIQFMQWATAQFPPPVGPPDDDQPPRNF